MQLVRIHTRSETIVGRISLWEPFTYPRRSRRGLWGTHVDFFPEISYFLTSKAVTECEDTVERYTFTRRLEKIEEI